MVSVIIPTLNAEDRIRSVIESLISQTLKPDEIIVVDSESEDNTLNICMEFQEVQIIKVKRKDFDHGGTRDMALRKSKGDIVIFLTDDAVPANDRFIENLVRHLRSEDNIAVVSGRQTARADATKTERLVREFNYPLVSNIRQKSDIKTYGIKTYFCTDVCAAYDREIYLKLGGFEHPLKTNEDMFFAAAAINHGYKAGYAADAEVVHSHNFTLKQQYRRNYIQGYEMEKHKELLGDVSAVSEGTKMVKEVSIKLLKNGDVFSFIYFGLDCLARLSGNRNGRKAALRKGEK